MSVTAYPTILIDSSTGSDTAASGAGPSTALTGTTAVSAGTTVVLDAGTVLTGVATDGSHVLYFADATAGNRNFTAINGTSGSGGATPTITVEQVLAITTKAWAIGGKRLTLTGSVSQKLYDNNGSTGDASAGWILEMQSGFAETNSSGLNVRSAGDQTSIGAFVIRGKPGASVLPIITLGASIIPRASYQHYEGFKVSDPSNSLNAFNMGANPSCITISKVTIGDVTNYFSRGFVNVGATHQITGCDIAYCSAPAINIAGASASVIGNKIHHGGSYGIDMSVGIDLLTVTIQNNEIVANASDGININSSPSSNRGGTIIGNTFDSNGGDGLELNVSGDGFTNLVVMNNIFSNNSAYGCDFSGDGLPAIMARGVFFANNVFYNNTSGSTNLSGGSYTGISGSTLDPQYTGGGDYTPTNTGLKNTAFPTALPGGGGINYQYPGAVQPNSAGGGSVTLVSVTQNVFLTDD